MWVSREMDEKKNVKICFAASSGGHYEQLMMLKPLMEKYDSFVITEKTDYSAEAKGEKTYYMKQVKHKKFLLITLICLIGIGISFLLFSAHRPFKDLEAADITSASVRLSPPDTTIQIVETEELVSYLNEVVIYNKDNSYTEYAGQAVIFTLSLADGSQVEITAYNPFIIIDGIGYKCKYEPCEALNHYANELMTREP